MPPTLSSSRCCLQLDCVDTEAWLNAQVTRSPKRICTAVRKQVFVHLFMFLEAYHSELIILTINSVYLARRLYGRNVRHGQRSTGSLYAEVWLNAQVTCSPNRICTAVRKHVYLHPFMFL